MNLIWRERDFCSHTTFQFKIYGLKAKEVGKNCPILCVWKIEPLIVNFGMNTPFTYTKKIFKKTTNNYEPMALSGSIYKETLYEIFGIVT